MAEFAEIVSDNSDKSTKPQLMGFGQRLAEAVSAFMRDRGKTTDDKAVAERTGRPYGVFGGIDADSQNGKIDAYLGEHLSDEAAEQLRGLIELTEVADKYGFESPDSKSWTSKGSWMDVLDSDVKNEIVETFTDALSETMPNGITSGMRRELENNPDMVLLMLKGVAEDGKVTENVRTLEGEPVDVSPTSPRKELSELADELGKINEMDSDEEKLDAIQEIIDGEKAARDAIKDGDGLSIVDKPSEPRFVPTGGLRFSRTLPELSDADKEALRERLEKLREDMKDLHPGHVVGPIVNDPLIDRDRSTLELPKRNLLDYVAMGIDSSQAAAKGSTEAPKAASGLDAASLEMS